MRKTLAFAVVAAITLAVILLVFRHSHDPSPAAVSFPVPEEATTSTSANARLIDTAGAGTSRAPASEPGASNAIARLIVLVISKNDHSPLAQARVGVSKKDERGPHILTDIQGSVGDFDHRPITGTDGRVELDLDPGVEFVLRALGETLRFGAASAVVSPLGPGETRTFTVELPSLMDSHVFGIVVAEDSGAPIDGARVLVSHDSTDPLRASTDPVRTDPEGRFDVELALKRQPHLEIEAKGYGMTFVVPGPGYGSEESPMVVRLVRSGTLIARILDRDGKPMSEGSVRLSAKGYELSGDEKNFRNDYVSLPNQEWSKRVDAEGTCRIDDLPAGVPLRVEVSIPHREGKPDRVPFSLLPGQVLEREWRIGAGCKLTGRVLDPEGASVHDISIWLVPDDASRIRRFDRNSIETKERATTSGTDGAFEFGDVDPGSWLIGPAPDSEEKSIAPFPELVEVPAEASDVVHDVRIVRGLFIRGRVVDSKDAPVPQSFVTGWMDGTHWLVEGQGKDDGGFKVGPLVPGQYKLSASAPLREDDYRSEAATAAAGNTNVILKLRAGGVVSGKVVDSRTGNPCSAEMVLSQHDDSLGYLSLPHSNEDGSFRCKGIPPGTYDVAARTPDGRAGRQSGIAVRAGAEAADVVIGVAPGARLRVRYEAASGYGQMQVRSGGCVVAADGIAAGSINVVVVPAGRVVAELMSPPQSREIDLAAGEEKTVVLTGPKRRDSPTGRRT